MPLWTAFTGGFYKARSTSMAAETAVNLYTETREVGESAKRSWMYGTPGQVLETELSTVNCRGWFYQDGRTWTVYGTTLYERVAPGAYVIRDATLDDDGELVSWATNGQGGDQLGIRTGSELRVLDLNTNVLSAAVVLPFSNPGQLAFQDGYALLTERDTIRFWFSALENMTTWDALDFIGRNTTSDNLVALAVSKDRVRVIGTKTSTLYYDSGDSDTPFLPYPSTTTQFGAESFTSVIVFNDLHAWVGRTANGEARVVVASDAPAETISTPPIADILERCTTLADVEGWGYEQGGHVFFVWNLSSSPDDLCCPCFDVTEKTWHMRAGWSEITGRFTPWNGRVGVVAGQDVLIGSRDSANVWRLELDAYDDAGAILMRERTSPYSGAENQWGFLDAVELGTEPGVGLTTGQGSDPQVSLEISRDGARSWVSAGFASIGAIGETLARTIWRRLGRVRQDRLVIRIRLSDPVKCVFGPGLWLRFSRGSGQL